jgi:hypothetical protein
MILKYLSLPAVLLILAFAGVAQTTQFSYQGKLTEGTAPANGQYDLTFKLFTAQSPGGSQVGIDVLRDDVQVTSGIFTVMLDFGESPFTGPTKANHLEVWVRPGASTGSYNQLLPRVPIASSPYAVETIRAQSADALSSSCVNCVTSGQIATVQGSQVTGNIAGSQINGAVPVASVPPGSANYIQNNPSTTQPTASFDISGTGRFGGTLRVEGNGIPTTDPITSFSSTGRFDIDAPFNPGGRLTVLNDGNVGIGTSSPLAKLDIFSGGASDGSGDLKAIALQYAGGGYRHWIRTRHNAFLSGGNAIDFFVNNSGTAAGSSAPGIGSLLTMTLDSGKVGIGIGSPTQKLDVSGTGVIRANVNSDSNAGFSLALNGASKWSLATVSPGQFQIFNQALSSNAFWIDNANNNIGISVTNPGYILDVGQRMRIRSGGNSSTSAGLWLNNNSNSEAAFIGMEDDTHVGFFGTGAGWKFGMNTTNGALRVNGSEGQAGEVIMSNGSGNTAQWKSPTNVLYQRTLMVTGTGSVQPPEATSVPVPGLSQTINVSGNAKLLIQFSVMGSRGTCIGCVSAQTSIEVYVDGVRVQSVWEYIPPDSLQHIDGSWIANVGPGSHTVQINATTALGGATFGCGGCSDKSTLIIQVIPE